VSTSPSVPSVIGISRYEKGIILPKISVSVPRYIITSDRNENITVARSDTVDTPPKAMLVISKVEDIANILGTKTCKILCQSLDRGALGSLSLDSQSAAVITPRVASA
jgi:hypothetical protein